MRLTTFSLLFLSFALSASAQERKPCTDEERQQYLRGFDDFLNCLPDADNPDPTDRRKFTIGFSVNHDWRFDTTLGANATAVTDHAGTHIQRRFDGFIWEYLVRDGDIGGSFGPYFGPRTAQSDGAASVLSYNTAPGFAVGDRYTLYRTRTVSASRTGWVPFSVNFATTLNDDNGNPGNEHLRVRYGYRYAGEITIRERSSIDSLSVDAVRSELHYFPSLGSFLIWDLDLSRRYTAWSSETSVSFHAIYGGAEYDLLTGKWYNLAAGGGLDIVIVKRSSDWTKTEYAYTAFAPEIAYPGKPLENFREELGEETGHEGHSWGEGRPYLSASAQFWPFRRFGITGQARWYPWLTTDSASAPSLLDRFDYVSTTRHWSISGGIVFNVRPGRRDRIE